MAFPERWLPQPEIPLGRSVPQGGKHSPRLFRASFDRALKPVWQRCVANRVGWHCDGVTVPFVAFADNIWILGHNALQIHTIWSWIVVASRAAGWQLPIDRMQWLSNGIGDDGSNALLFTPEAADEWAVAKRLKDDASYKALGIWTNARGSTEADVTQKVLSYCGRC